MKAILWFQDVLVIMNDGLARLETNVNEAHKDVNCELSNKYGKYMFLICQCLDPNILGRTPSVLEYKQQKIQWS